MMKEKLKKILYVLTIAFTASSLNVYAINSIGPDDPVTKKVVTPAVANTTFGLPSPRPIQSNIDHLTANMDFARPVLSIEESTASATPVSVGGASMPMSFRGASSNTIIGAENLNGVFNQIARGNKTVKIVQIGDSHVRGNIFPQTIQKMIEGKINDGDRRVSFSYIGINGARASKFTSDDMLRKVANMNPDLVVISFGTNEAHGNFSSSSNTHVMESLVNGIRRSCPNVTFLITTTPGSYISRGGGKVINKTHENVAQNLLAFGRDNGIAVWDLYHNIGGNDYACQNLINARMMQNDRVHLTASGYRMIGNMFGEAFLNAYNRFLKR